MEENSNRSKRIFFNSKSYSNLFRLPLGISINTSNVFFPLALMVFIYFNSLLISGLCYLIFIFLRRAKIRKCLLCTIEYGANFHFGRLALLNFNSKNIDHINFLWIKDNQFIY